MMEFMQLLQKLKDSNQFTRSLISKEIFANLRRNNGNELLDIILELLRSSADIEFQVKLLSILTACLLYNNMFRYTIITWPYLYEPLRKILARGLPMKCAVALDFVTSLLYADEAGPRSATLTLRAQGMIRTSGCLTAMAHLFTNHMLPMDTWKALCRCLAEVCRSCEPNQTFCSHLIPLCIQRCHQGNLDAFPVLQSLLMKNKRNTHLFLNTNGVSLFDRKELLRVDACLELLNTVIQNAEFEALSIMKKKTKIYEYLQELLELHSPHSSVTQWATITMYYLDSKLKDICDVEDKVSIDTSIVRTNVRNVRQDKDLSNGNNTQVLLQNIMSEILSYPPKSGGFNNNLWKNICEVPHLLANNVNDISQHTVKEKNVHGKEINNFCKKQASRTSIDDERKDQLSFSFLLDESVRCDESDLANKLDPKYKTDQSIINDTRYKYFREECDHSPISETVKTLKGNFENILEFKPIFVSTPLREVSDGDCNSLHNHTSVKRHFTQSSNKSRIRNRTAFKKISKTSLSQEKSSVKNKSMSSRLLDAINESCTTIINSVKKVFIGNKSSNKHRKSAIKDIKTDQTYCSYSFTNFMRKREAELLKPKDNTNISVKGELSTHNTLSTCRTCDDTLLLKRKFDTDENLRMTVKKLKLGINLYGCNFKRISKTMWPREKYMTPIVLYNLYRKLILK